MRTSLVDTVVRGVAPVLRAELGAAHARIVTLERDLLTVTARYDALAERLAAVEARAPLPGRDGRDGAPGERGERGLDGTPGAQGRDGLDGLPGRDGKDGRDGVSPDPEAIRRDIETEVARRVALIPVQVGPPGPQGERGEKGLDGTHGRDGIDGKDGLPGRDGKDGVDGKDGKDGQPGRDGRDGLSGIAGEKGLDGAPGRDGTNGRDGLDGKDAVIDLGVLTTVQDETDPTIVRLVADDGTAVKGHIKIYQPLYRNVWEATKQYTLNEIVTQDGGMWVALKANTGVKPGTDQAAGVWQLGSKRGPIGPRGEKGADGKDGRPGRDLTQMDDTGRKW